MFLTIFIFVFFPEWASAQGSLCPVGPLALTPEVGCGGVGGCFLDNYSGFGSVGRWRSGKSCKYEGGELNYS